MLMLASTRDTCLSHLHADQFVAPDVHVSDLVVDDGGEVEGRELLLLVRQVLEAEEGAVELVVRQRVAGFLHGKITQRGNRFKRESRVD